MEEGEFWIGVGETSQLEIAESQAASESRRIRDRLTYLESFIKHRQLTPLNNVTVIAVGSIFGGQDGIWETTKCM